MNNTNTKIKARHNHNLNEELREQLADSFTAHANTVRTNDNNEFLAVQAALDTLFGAVATQTFKPSELLAMLIANTQTNNGGYGLASVSYTGLPFAAAPITGGDGKEYVETFTVDLVIRRSSLDADKDMAAKWREANKRSNGGNVTQGMMMNFNNALNALDAGTDGYGNNENDSQ